MMAEGSTLRLQRILPAPRAVVWAALTDPEEIRAWWGPKGYEARHVRFEPRVGADYRIEMQPPEGDVFFLSGTFREVVPPHRLAYTFVWDPPDPDDRETTAQLVLEDRGGRTDVAFTQGPFATEARRALHEGGWTDSFDRLEQHLAARSG